MATGENNSAYVFGALGIIEGQIISAAQAVTKAAIEGNAVTQGGAGLAYGRPHFYRRLPLRPHSAR